MAGTILDVYEDDFGSILPISLKLKDGTAPSDITWATASVSLIEFKHKDLDALIGSAITNSNFTIDTTNKIVNYTPTAAQITTLAAEIENGDVVSLDGFVKLKTGSSRVETFKFTMRVHKS